MTRKSGCRRHEVDLGLAVIESVRRPGECLSCGEIAAVCEVSPQAIRYILNRALAKMRAKALTRLEAKA